MTTKDSTTNFVVIQNEDTAKLSDFERDDSAISATVNVEPGVIKIKLCDTVDCSSEIRLHIENEMFNWIQISMRPDKEFPAETEIPIFWKGVPAFYWLNVSDQGSR